MTGERTASPWIRRFHPAPDADARLVCFPHAGGSASFYFPVSQRLAPAIDVLSIQYPGRQDRRGEPAVADLTQLGELVADELRDWLDRPIALFGHSMGATIAFEVARLLERDGTPPIAFFCSSRTAPHIPWTTSVVWTDDECLIGELVRLNGTDTQVLRDPDMLDLVLPVLRDDYRAIAAYKYRPGPALSCPITAFIGDRDPQVSVGDINAWARHTTAAFDLTVFSGGHFYINTHATAVIDAVADGMRLGLRVA